MLWEKKLSQCWPGFLWIIILDATKVSNIGYSAIKNLKLVGFCYEFLSILIWIHNHYRSEAKRNRRKGTNHSFLTINIKALSCNMIYSFILFRNQWTMSRWLNTTTKLSVKIVEIVETLPLSFFISQTIFVQWLNSCGKLLGMINMKRNTRIFVNLNDSLIL